MTLNVEAMARSRGWDRDDAAPVWRDSQGRERAARGPLGWGVDGATFDTEAAALAAAIGLSPAHARAVEFGWDRSDDGTWLDGGTPVVWGGEAGWWGRSLEDEVARYSTETEALYYAAGLEQPTVGALLVENEKLRGIIDSLVGGE